MATATRTENLRQPRQPPAPTLSGTFYLFGDLPDSVQRHILSLVSEAPWERINDGRGNHRSDRASTATSSLTQSLPWVSRAFREYCASDSPWREALQRAVTYERSWRRAVLRYAPSLMPTENNSQSLTTVSKAIQQDLPWSLLVERLLQYGQQQQQQQQEEEHHRGHRQRTASPVQRYTSSYCSLYRYLYLNYIRYEVPVFFMPMAGIDRDQHPDYELHLFEPRYRLMMAELIQRYSSASSSPSTPALSPPLVHWEAGRDIDDDHEGDSGSERVGGADSESRGRMHLRDEEDDGPCFVHVVDRRGRHAPTGALVQVRRCLFAPDGRALVRIRIIGTIRITRCWVRPDSHSLYYAIGHRDDEAPLS